MKNKFLIYCSLFAFTLFFSCKNQQLTSSTTIKYGTSFGMCVNYCKTDLVLVNAKATLARSKNGNNPDTKTCSKELDESTLTELRNQINVDAFNKLPDVIGCPDCADGGAEYLEITNNGSTKKVVFEYNKAPTEIANTVNQLKAIVTSLNDCK